MSETEVQRCPNHSLKDWLTQVSGEIGILMMYEDTSEGTPISPPFATPEELAHWLADNNASAFGGMTATYEQWLATCQQGYAVGMVMEGRRLMSGVEFNETAGDSS